MKQDKHEPAPTWIVLVFIFFASLLPPFIVFHEILIIGAWKNADKIGGLATGFATLVAATALLIGLREYRRSERREKRQRTYNLCNNYYSPEIYDYLADAMDMLASLKEDKVKIDIVFNRQNYLFKRYRKPCGILFAYFEDLSLMYKNNLIDREIVMELFGEVIPSIYKDAECIIMKFREKEDDEVYKNWEICARHINELLRSPKTRKTPFEFVETKWKNPSTWDGVNL